MPAGASTNNIQAVTTNLFFTMNYMHDLFYDSGFDEASGNPQATTTAVGGVEGDPILAESQDYSGLDNANASRAHRRHQPARADVPVGLRQRRR